MKGELQVSILDKMLNIFIILEIVILKKQFLNSILCELVKDLPEAGDRRQPWEKQMIRWVTLHGMMSKIITMSRKEIASSLQFI